MSVHPIPAAIDGLISLWDGHGALAYDVDGQSTPLRVIDGPALADFDDFRVLLVGVASQALTGGMNPFANLDAAEGRTGFGHGGRRTMRFEIACQLGVWSGDTGMSTVRSTAYEVLSVLGRLLTENRTLSGVVDWARITRDAYQPAQSPDGSGVSLDFTVQVEATRFDY